MKEKKILIPKIESKDIKLEPVKNGFKFAVEVGK